MSFMDALFIATSAVCVAGLVIKDISTDFSLFGQLVILLLIQIGGFGYMTVATMPALLLGRKIGLKEQWILQEALNLLNLGGIMEFLWGLIKITLLFEGKCRALALLYELGCVSRRSCGQSDHNNVDYSRRAGVRRVSRSLL